MIPDDRFIEILLNADEPVLGTAEVAEQIDIGREGTHKRLKELQEKGEIGGKTVARVSVWWHPERVNG